MSQSFPASNSPEFAKQLIEQMAAVYASCRSYMDEGEVTTVFINKDNSERRTVIRPFSRAFIRPSNFRFEFRNRHQEDLEWDRYIVWQDGESVQTWWSVRPGVETQPTLMLAIAGATGVSGESAVTISNLLMPDTIKCNGILSLTDFEIVREEIIEKTATYKVQGSRLRYKRDGKLDQRELTLWIDTQTLLILKTFHVHQFEDFETETTTTYQPQINVTVPPDKLAFHPSA